MRVPSRTRALTSVAMLCASPRVETCECSCTHAMTPDATMAYSSSHRKMRNQWRLPLPMALPTCTLVHTRAVAAVEHVAHALLGAPAPSVAAASPPTHPGAEVVKDLYAAVGDGAVLGAQRPHQAARDAELVPVAGPQRGRVERLEVRAAQQVALQPARRGADRLG